MAHETVDARAGLLRLTGEDWARIREATPDIDDVLRRACNIQRSQPVFDADGNPMPLLLVRLRSVPKSHLPMLLDALAAVVRQNADTPTATDEEAEEKSGAGEEMEHTEAIVDDLSSDEAAETAVVALDQVECARRVLAELRDSHAGVLAALARITTRAREGMLASDADIGRLGSWQDKLAEAAAALKVDAEAASVRALEEEVEKADAALRAADELAALAHMLADIAWVEVSGARMAVAEAVRRAGTADAAALPEEDRSLFRALYRLMRSTSPVDADPGDAELVSATFGMPALLAAVGALAETAAKLGGPELEAAEPAAQPEGTEPEAVQLAATEADAADSDAADAWHVAIAVPEPASEVASKADPVAALESVTAETPVDAEPEHAAEPEYSAEAEADRPEAAESAEPQAAASEGSGAEAEALTGIVGWETAAESAAEVQDTPPDRRIVAALRDGRTGLAYWYSVALGLPEPVQAAFEVLALSEAVAVDGDDASLRIRELVTDFDVITFGEHWPDYLGVLAAGSAHALLRMPFSPCATVLDESLVLVGNGGHDYLSAVLRASQVGFRPGMFGDVGEHSIQELTEQRAEALVRLRSALDAARGAKTKFSRASDVLRRIASDGEPVGHAVSLTLQTPEEVQLAEELLAQVYDRKSIDKLIDDTDQRMNPVASRRNKIIGGARDQVRSRVDDVLEALRGYVEAARVLASRRRLGTSDQRELSEAIDSLTITATDADAKKPETSGVGSLAIELVRHWTRAILDGQATGDVRASRIESDLAKGFEVSVTEDGTILPSSVTPEALDAIARRSAEEAYEGFADRDDFAGAERLIEVLRAGGESELATRLENRQPEDIRNSRERLRGLAEEAERELASALFAALLTDSESSELGVVLARYQNPDVDDFPVARRHLSEIIQRVESARALGIEKARAQLAGLECSAEARERIISQLDVGDLVNAQENLAHLSSGASSLPSEAATDDTFSDFWPEFIQAASATADPGWLKEAAARHAEIAGTRLLPEDADPSVEAALHGWVRLAIEKRGGTWQRCLKDVLYLAGLEVRGEIPYNRQNHAGRWSTMITARPVGRALVPAYGSAASGTYQVLLCWVKVAPDQILEMVEELPKQGPVIVLYFNSLLPRERRMLAEHSRDKDISAVVIDSTVITFLATRTGPRLRATMALTLPFTAINPYTPFVLGDVPREVFYGRERELHQVQDENGPLFVYGGRQLGKSTLLKTAMRDFTEQNEYWRSIYIDLKAEGIGELRLPDDLWSLLIPRLQQAGIISVKVSQKALPDTVVSGIRDWLDKDPRHRFLLLLDEADAFLETDARPREGKAGDTRFVNVYRLKNLTDGSARRFKPVFAGLHRVQRFHSISNGPMAHVGTEILIGPLPQSEAYKLVVNPLAAIGYRFDRPDIAWRLLAYTNYQASLIQAFCNALVRHMHRKRITHDAPPTVISDRDIEEVYSDRELRDWIASRFELTINLDNRYRVIAYTTAWLTSYSDKVVFAVSTLYDECKYFWPTGFAGLNLDDFAAYLDEMVGLGVLVRARGDEYGIRSPNVIRLLGAPAEIDRKLQESEDVLAVTSLFDPAVFRRKLGDDPDRRSPLSEQQVQQALETPRQLHAILGTRALGLDRVAEALRLAAPEDIEIREVTRWSVNAEVSALSRAKSGRQHIVLDLTDGTEAEQKAAVRQLSRFVVGSDRRTASCLAPPSAEWLWAGEVPEGVSIQLVRLRPWTQDALRAWAAECQYPLDTADQRRQLLDDTGGWPQLVEAAARAARGGQPDLRARQEAMSLVSDRQAAADFLDSVGMPADPVTDQVAGVLATWSDEITFEDLATLVSLDQAAVQRVLERLLDLSILDYGTTADSYRVNPLMARLLREA